MTARKPARWLAAAVVLGSLRAASVAGGASPVGAFQDVPVYHAGERVDGLPLVSVLRRHDIPGFVSFVYGDCVASDDAGCVPPAEVQIWPACHRNLGMYDGVEPSVAPEQRTALRGVPALLFEDGTRLELGTGRSTVVVFAATRTRTLRIAGALRAADGTVLPERLLPRPLRDSEEGARVVDC